MEFHLVMEGSSESFKRLIVDESYDISHLWCVFFRAGGHDTGDELKRTGRFCGGLIDDIKRKAPFIANGSDFIDALNLQAGLSEPRISSTTFHGRSPF